LDERANNIHPNIYNSSQKDIFAYLTLIFFGFTDIYTKHVASSLTCANLKNVADPATECFPEIISGHCARVLDHVDTSKGLVLGRKRNEKGAWFKVSNVSLHIKQNEMLCCFVCSVSTFRVLCVKASENWSRGELGSIENRDNKIVKNHVTTVKVKALP